MKRIISIFIPARVCAVTAAGGETPESPKISPEMQSFSVKRVEISRHVELRGEVVLKGRALVPEGDSHATIRVLGSADVSDASGEIVSSRVPSWMFLDTG